ncbi:MAG: pyridoxamine 5'-phosphate oxidase [Bacteroidales bacterium]|nr:pyridoxamine 5'-phosphate oxidase [Bacteroidales bacterium]
MNGNTDKNISGLRVNYLKNKLEGPLPADPLTLFHAWFDEYLQSGLSDSNAMVLATAGDRGLPSARVVLLRDYNKKGFIFFTNYESRKGKELRANPMAALLFFWKEHERQVRVEGKTMVLSSKKSDTYFDSRPLGSRISAVVSPQSQVIPGRQYLEDRWQEIQEKCEEKKLKRPPYWGGYRLEPLVVEFWQGRENRLHDRIRYKKTATGWVQERLAP